MKSDFDLVTQGFIQYLEKSGQLHKLPHLAKDHIRLSRSLYDPNLAIVQSAVPLSPQDKKLLSSKLEHIFHRPITIENRINKDLIAGLFIRLGDQIIDLSVKTRLLRLKDQLTYA